MKTNLHPQYIKTEVKCNGCGNSFTTRSTVAAITVEICSNCHPFYTGKQKLVDTAGRVDKFNARRAKADKLRQSQSTPASNSEVVAIKPELETETVEPPEQTEA